MKALDYLIIGQGLAGSILSYELIKKGKSVLVIDQPSKNISSTVAAGLYNPVTGRTMVKTWMADQLFPIIPGYYSELEILLKKRFHYEKEIYRPFISIEEFNDWIGKSSDPKYRPYIKYVSNTSRKDKHIKDPFGGITLNLCGYVDVKSFIASYRQYLIRINAFLEEEFQEQKLAFKKNEVIYHQHAFKKVIFCTGFSTSNSSFFDWLPFNPVKGEIITIKHHIHQEKIYNRGVFAIPIDEGMARVGATYDNDISNTAPTEKAVKYLSDKLSNLMNIDYEITSQMVGIRPATKDRRPFIGMHPEHSKLGVFNGFGSKGVSLTPYFAIQFVNHLEKTTNLSVEVDIKRYFSL